MTDQPADEVEVNEEDEVEAYSPPVILGDGDLVVFDPDYLDPSYEATGVLAIEHDTERGSRVLIGSGGGDTYRQTWHRIGEKLARGGSTVTRIN